MNMSLKQLLRTPGKAALFFLLMLATALMLTVGTVTTVEANQRIGAAEAQYHTVGFVAQKPAGLERVSDAQGNETLRTDYGAFIPAEALRFDGAQYVHPPEDRPYYFAWAPTLREPHPGSAGYTLSVAEFVPQETESGWEISIEKIHFIEQGARYRDLNFKEGDVVRMDSTAATEALIPGRRYIAFLQGLEVGNNSFRYRIQAAPYTSQSDRAGNVLPSGVLPAVSAYEMREGADGSRRVQRAEEVTEGFYESVAFERWEQWIEISKRIAQMFPVLPTNSLELLPSFRKQQAQVVEGRAITQEEFAAGAQVILISDDMAAANGLQVGDTVTLPLYGAVYDPVFLGEPSIHQFTWESLYKPAPGFSLLNAQGAYYQPFFEAEYTVVGIYRHGMGDIFQMAFSGVEVGDEVMIVPAKSIGASDAQNLVFVLPMNAQCASFEIKNGTADAFDAALRAAVPEREKLEIEYYDGGYSEIIGKLRTARTAAVLLLAVGIASALAVVLLALYFFVVKQQRRTAIERSLGMTKRQCRVSILAGLMVLMFLAVVLGTALGGVVLHMDSFTAGEETTTEEAPDGPMLGSYRTDYSLWAMAPTQELDESGVGAPYAVYILIPLALCGGTLGLALWLVGRNLKIEPILLLSGRGE